MPIPDFQDEQDTIVVPARPEGFERVFLGEHCWYSIHLSPERLPRIKYIAGYVTRPTSAITHFAKVSRIEPHGGHGKYKLIFAGPAEKIGPIPLEDAPGGFMQRPRFTSFKKLKSAKKLADLY